ncbi:MAG: quinone-dependent dihydroorotate dehydrogenase [Bacteroidota bacterium]
MYTVLKQILFLFDPEKVHNFTFKLIRFWLKVPGVKSSWKKKYVVEDEQLHRNVFGLTFKNPVGLAAGFDKNATLYNELSHCGFGFIEVGTVTPEPQPGNPKKRLFRLKKDEALINRMGFNNEGVQSMVQQLKQKNTDLLIGGNIGKNKTTPNDRAKDDYLKSFEILHPHVDYFVVNVSSPNTPNLRALQDKKPLTELLTLLNTENNKQRTRRPILLKIAPDLTSDQLDDVIDIVRTTGTAGIIATNTTIDRSDLSVENPEHFGPGGLSGRPLRKKATEVIRYLHEHADGEIPIIGVGGIHSAEDAIEKLEAGAALVQIYTGFVYEGPELVRKINEALLKK